MIDGAPAARSASGSEICWKPKLGGHDNIRDLTDLWIGRDYRAIGPSRFGYFGSAMPDNASPADQADCYAALLDHLDPERVMALGLSAGGPAAI